MKIGMENEYIVGWGPEDMERFKRVTILDYPIYRSPDCIFHLWHPRNLNINYPLRELEIKNKTELFRVCSLSKKELSDDIKKWEWLNLPNNE